MGGGYLFNEAEKFSDFFQAVAIFRDEFGLEFFIEPGAYTISKAHRFNGISLPTIYTRKSDGAVQLIKEDTFDEYASTSGVIKSVPVWEESCDSNRKGPSQSNCSYRECVVVQHSRQIIGAVRRMLTRLSIAKLSRNYAAQSCCHCFSNQQKWGCHRRV
jgi:hypothetical protein